MNAVALLDTAHLWATCSGQHLLGSTQSTDNHKSTTNTTHLTVTFDIHQQQDKQLRGILFPLAKSCKALLVSIMICDVLGPSFPIKTGFSPSHCHHLLTHCSQLCNPAPHLHAHLFWAHVVGFSSSQNKKHLWVTCSPCRAARKWQKEERSTVPPLQETDAALWNRRPTTMTKAGDLTHDRVRFKTEKRPAGSPGSATFDRGKQGCSSALFGIGSLNNCHELSTHKLT